MAKDTKERILTAALDMFSKKGYEGTNIRELAASLGLVKSGIYKHYVYEELREIRTPQDIGDLEWASGGFHDAFIAEEKKQEDGRLYLKFDGTWGCNIEVWFWRDLDYNNPVVEPEDGDPYWYDSTIILHDGFIYFVDDEISSIDQIRSGHYHFKARHMQYRIIPN